MQGGARGVEAHSVARIRCGKSRLGFAQLSFDLGPILGQRMKLRKLCRALEQQSVIFAVAAEFGGAARDGERALWLSRAPKGQGLLEIDLDEPAQVPGCGVKRDGDVEVLEYLLRATQRTISRRRLLVQDHQAVLVGGPAREEIGR